MVSSTSAEANETTAYTDMHFVPPLDTNPLSNYKVDCACHKGNQSCPVQKHNLRPKEDPSCTPSAPSSLTGAETRQRKARKKERGEGPATGATSDEGSQQPEAGELHAASDTEVAFPSES